MLVARVNDFVNLVLQHKRLWDSQEKQRLTKLQRTRNTHCCFYVKHIAFLRAECTHLHRENVQTKNQECADR